MRRLETLFIVLGLAFYVWFLRQLGIGQVYGYVRLVGWGLAVTIGLEGVARLANTIGWRVTIADYPENLTMGELFAARVAGEAIDYTTPSAQLGGQLVMALMVREKLAISAGLATVAVAALAEAAGQIVFIVAALLSSLRLAATIRSLMWPVTAGLVITIALATAFYVVQTKQPFSHLWRAASRLRLSNLATTEVWNASAEADAMLADFYSYQRGRLVISAICYLFAWSLGPLEIYLVLTLLGQKATVQTALLAEALGLLIERVTFMIPAKLVSQEGGKALVLGLLGYPAGIGFAVGFLRRVKEMVWVLIGLTIFTFHRLFEARKALERSPGGAQARAQVSRTWPL